MNYNYTNAMETKFEAKVAIILVTFNALEKTKESLGVLSWAKDEPDVEVFLTDNNSQEPMTEFVTENYPWIHFYPNKNNIGFAGGMSFILSKIWQEGFDFDYLMIVNPDLCIDRQSALSLVRSLAKSSDRTGIVGPMVVSSEGKPEYTVLKDLKLASFLYKIILQQVKSSTISPGFVHPLPQVITYVDGLSGACLVFKRSLIDEIGFFDTDYFMYQEDRDFSLKARKAGWKILYNPEVQVKHYKGSSSEGRKDPSLWLREQVYISILIFFKKNKGKVQTNILKFFLIAFLWARILSNKDRQWASKLLARIKNTNI